MVRRGWPRGFRGNAALVERRRERRILVCFELTALRANSQDAVDGPTFMWFTSKLVRRMRIFCAATGAAAGAAGSATACGVTQGSPSVQCDAVWCSQEWQREC